MYTDYPLKVDKAGDHSERRVLEALGNLDDSWKVLGDLQWREIEGKNIDRSGEIDLVLFHPEYGLLIIEGKGGSIVSQNGELFYQSIYDGYLKNKVPPAGIEPAAPGLGNLCSIRLS